MVNYSKKTKIIQYTPSDAPPTIHELVDISKYNELVDAIDRDEYIDGDIKDFLKIAATRHYKFNYSKIADYYAQSSAEVQHLMEQSALVIIDINDAIENGYLKLSEKIREIMENQDEK